MDFACNELVKDLEGLSQIVTSHRTDTCACIRFGPGEGQQWGDDTFFLFCDLTLSPLSEG